MKYILGILISLLVCIGALTFRVITLEGQVAYLMDLRHAYEVTN